MNQLISRRTIEDALDNAEVNYSEETINDTYSGRGMYGDTCLSVVFEGKRIQRDLCRFMIELGAMAQVELEGYEADAHLHAIVRYLAQDVCTDDLGLDMIVYFPGWKLAD